MYTCKHFLWKLFSELLCTVYLLGGSSAWKLPLVHHVHQKLNYLCVCVCVGGGGMMLIDTTRQTHSLFMYM